MLLRMLPEHLRAFHACLVALKDAMDACFSFNLDLSYENKLAKFKEAYKALDISITSCFVMFQSSLEQCNSKFDQLFHSHLVKDINHPRYPDHLLHA